MTESSPKPASSSALHGAARAREALRRLDGELEDLSVEARVAALRTVRDRVNREIDVLLASLSGRYLVADKQEERAPAPVRLLAPTDADVERLHRRALEIVKLQPIESLDTRRRLEEHMTRLQLEAWAEGAASR